MHNTIALGDVLQSDDLISAPPLLRTAWGPAAAAPVACDRPGAVRVLHPPGPRPFSSLEAPQSPGGWGLAQRPPSQPAASLDSSRLTAI